MSCVKSKVGGGGILDCSNSYDFTALRIHSVQTSPVQATVMQFRVGRACCTGANWSSSSLLVKQLV